MKLLVGLRNHVYADFIAYNLRLLGCNAKVVEDGIGIVDLLFGQDWDIVIIGIHIGYYNGLEILNKYQKYSQERLETQDDFVKAKIFIASSFYDKLSMQQAKTLGVADYFVMPQDTDELLYQILKK